MESSHSQVTSAQECCIDCIDWDEIEKDLEAAPVVLPKNAITTEMMMERYDISNSSALRRIHTLVKTGKYNEFWFVAGRGKSRYILPVK